MRPHEHAFALDVSKEILEKAEGFDKEDWPLTCEQLATSTHEWLADIYTCYGCKPYWQTEVLEQTEKERSGETESEKMTQKRRQNQKKTQKKLRLSPYTPLKKKGEVKREAFWILASKEAWVVGVGQ